MSGWGQRAVGEVCEVIAGQSPKSSAYNDAGDGLPFYQGKKDFTDRYVAPPSTWTTSITKRALPDDILMSVRAPVGPINIARDEVCIGRGLAAIRAGKEIDRGFLWYALLWLQPKIVGNAGAVFPSISKKQIEALPLPVPPKEVQKRLVAVLDEAFAALDRARANAEANLTDAEIIYRSQLVSTFDAETIEMQRLADVCDVRDGTHDTPKYVEDGVPLVTQKNVRRDGMHFEKCKNISYSDHQEISKRSRVEKGDILMSMIGVNRGECCLVESESEFSIKNVGLIRQTPAFDMQYLLQYLQSPMADKYVDHSTNGGAQPFVGLGKLRDFPVPKVSIAQQKKVITDLLTIRSRMRSLSAKCLEKLQDLEDLRQSILQKALSGELT